MLQSLSERGAETVWTLCLKQCDAVTSGVIVKINTHTHTFLLVQTGSVMMEHLLLHLSKVGNAEIHTEISDFHGGDYEERSILGCESMWLL
jgi:hypothetical protein